MTTLLEYFTRLGYSYEYAGFLMKPIDDERSIVIGTQGESLGVALPARVRGGIDVQVQTQAGEVGPCYVAADAFGADRIASAIMASYRDAPDLDDDTRRIFVEVTQALDKAEELGAPEGARYVAVMKAIAMHVSERARRCEEQTNGG